MQLNKGSPVVVYTPAILQYHAELSTEEHHRITIKVKSVANRSGWRQTTVPAAYVHDARLFSFGKPTGRELPFRFSASTPETDQQYFWILLKS